MDTKEVSLLLQRLHLQQYIGVFEEEELTELWLLRSMGSLLLSNLSELGLDERSAAAIVAEVLAPANEAAATPKPGNRSPTAVNVTYADLRLQWATASADYCHRDGVECLRILDQPVMEDWEAPYMRSLATVACSRGGRVLEVGFGLGISAKYIDEHATNPPRDVDDDAEAVARTGAATSAWVTEHVIIEANSEIAIAARRFAETARVKTTVIEGFWQDAVVTLQPGSFAGVLFDTFPLSGRKGEYGECNSFYPAAARLLETGGLFTFYFDVAESWLSTKRIFQGEATHKLYAAGFTNVDEEEVMCKAPLECEYFWKDRFLVPIATRGNTVHSDWPHIGQVD